METGQEPKQPKQPKQPRGIGSLWKAAWRDAVRRPELAARVREVEAGVRAAATAERRMAPARDVATARLAELARAGGLEAGCRSAVMRSLRADVEAYRKLVRELRVAVLVTAAASAAAAGVYVGLPDLAGLPDVLAVALGMALVLLFSVGLGTAAGGIVMLVGHLVQRARTRKRLREKLDALLLPYLRRQLSHHLQVALDCLDVRDQVGLSEVVDASLEVATDARASLASLFARMRSGCVGISGSRGAGKTTLIRAACEGGITPDDMPPTLGVRVAAPVQWKADEFVPFLFAELCAAVAPWLDEGGVDPRRANRRKALAASVLLLVAIGLYVVAGRVDDGERLVAIDASKEVVALYAGAAAALLGALELIRRLSRETDLTVLASRRMRELRYRKTIVEGWSVEASSRLGPKIGRTREASVTQLPLTLPEVVGRYKAFVGRVAREHTLVIGIDELDKMESAEEAERFLRDVKVLFGDQRCFYLVSLSDDAMSEFERRGLPVRNVFDSSFDDVLHVEPLSYPESHEIVNGRVVGMGDGYVALCHVMSGGVPRELIRSVRTVIEAHSPYVPSGIDAATGTAPPASAARTPRDVARVVALERLARVERAVRTTAAGHGAAGGRHPLLDWLDRLPPLDPSADDVLESLVLHGGVAEPHARLGVHPLRRADRAAQRALLLELAVVAYRVATTIELWDRLDERLLGGADGPAGASPEIELVARAWRDLAGGAAGAWRTVDAARGAMGVTAWAFPLDAVEAAVDGDGDAARVSAPQ